MQFSDPTRFLVAHGRRAWASGYGDGGLEIWAGALQIASDLHPEFRRGGDVTAIPGEGIVSKIEAEPSHVVRTYTGPDFAVEEQVWVPLEETAVLVRYIVRSVRPVQVIARFRPSLNLMWPAALGGQEIRWDPAQSGYLLTDSGRQFAAAVLAPGATEHDEPLNSAHPLPQTDELAVALDQHSPQLLFTRIPPVRSGKFDLTSARALLQFSTWQPASEKHYQQVLASHVRIDTPDAALNQALAWAEIALDQDWLCNDDLGCAYVAGFGPSRRNRRPQYAWFFSGDGMIASHAAMAEGDLNRARDEIRFIAKYQDRGNGMIWHELSQSAPYIDWRGKYPYMFVHADLTYPYISTVADYVRNSNDRAFLREIWPSVQHAFAYGRSLVSEGGLPRIPEGKEGGDEQDPLREELSLSASWVEACADYAHLAAVMGDPEAARQARDLAQQARSSFAQRYWDAQRGSPIEAYRRNGEPMLDRGLGAIVGINQRLFNDQQNARVLDDIASWRFQSDWGTRNIAMGEPGFDPTGYAHGTVWALATADVALAYWTAHRPETAWEVWRTLIPWSTLDSPGHMHEVLAGDTYHPQLESVPEQSWSSASFLTSAVRGLFGIDINAEDGILTIAPHLPAEWDHATVSGLHLGASTLNLRFEQQSDELSLRILTSGPPVHIRYDPEIPLGARIQSARGCGRRIEAKQQQKSADQHVMADIVVPQGTCEISLRYRDGVSIIMPAPQPSLGDPSTGMKLTTLTLAGNILHLGLDVVPVRQNRIQLRTDRTVNSASGAEISKVASDSYELSLPRTSGADAYQHLQVSVSFSD